MNELEKRQARVPLYLEELRRHGVLSQYWDKLTVILKGSTARGYSDQYADLDFVIFTDSESYKAIVDGYVKSGLSMRTDGVFLPLGDWEGHYNLNTYQNLKGYFDGRDVLNIWEYTHVLILHDPAGAYEDIVREKAAWFKGQIDSCIRGEYMQAQLQLDWMRQPLRRADTGAALLYGAAVWRACCRLAYLLCGEAYPCDKWLFFYLDRLPLAGDILDMLKGYGKAFDGITALSPHRKLNDYKLYDGGEKLLSRLVELLHERYGDAQWIDHWYLYA